MSARYGKAPLALAFALLLAGVSGLALARLHWEPLLEAGLMLGTGEQAAEFVAPRSPGRPLVLAMGDSTLRPPKSFPTQLAARMGGAADVRTMWGPGLSPAEQVLLAARALELEPEAVILLAHFATFDSTRPLRYPQLMRFVPPRRLPDLLTLPFSARGVGVAEIVLGSASGAVIPASWSQALAGGTRWLEHALEERFGVEPGTDLHRLGKFARLREESILRSTREVYPGHPSLEMLRAAVRMIEGEGTQALVVISPVNVAPLRELGGFDAEDLSRRVAHVRDAVESEGGDVVDMHDGLPLAEFADELGHYTQRGAWLISLPVEDWLRRVLGLPDRRKAQR